LCKFIEENFKKRKCVYFLPDPQKGEGMCKCGYLKSSHNELCEGEQDTEKWTSQKHTVQVPTDAYGDVVFDELGQRGKYVRLASDTNPEILYELMTKYWRLKTPNLIISVTGGAKNLPLKAPMRKIFSRLIYIARSQGAWIFTAGTNHGVMRHIGEVVRDHTLSKNSEEKIVTIGIAAWGMIHNRESLIRKPETQGYYTAHYVLDKENRGSQYCLDNNHSHLILVDNGSHAHYTVEQKIRTNLETYISENVTTGSDGAKIPIICFAQEGGKGTLQSIHHAVKSNIPCVIVRGTGRVADVIASFVGEDATEISSSTMKEKIEKYLYPLFMKLSEKDKQTWTHWFEEVLEKPHLLTVINMEDANDEIVTEAISLALFKEFSEGDNLGKRTWHSQMKILLEWNQAELARKELFQVGQEWQLSDLKDLMYTALIKNKPDFVRLFLENGFGLKRFASPTTLTKLYTKHFRGQDSFKLHKAKKSSDDSLLEMVWKMIKHFQSVESKLQENSQWLFDMSLKEASLVSRHPIQTLFLWAVLQKKKELSFAIWEKIGGCTMAALGAAKILRKLAQKEEDDNISEELKSFADDYETCAIDVFAESYNDDEEMATKLLVQPCDFWDNSSCLVLAAHGNAKQFVAITPVQTFLSKKWHGEISEETRTWKILLCMLFFPLIFCGLITFSKEPAMKERKTLLPAQRYFTAFFTSPFVIFCWNVLSYLAFLLLFAYVLLVDYQLIPSWPEYLLYFWVFTLFCEEIRQGIMNKISNYLDDFWNMMDVMALVWFMVALLYRLIPSTMYTPYVGKVFFCIDYIIFTLRLIHIFTANRYIGPKIIMVQKMMIDVFFFLFLFAVWMIAYGVAKQGMMRHNEHRLDQLLRSVVYEPYLTLFGEIPQDTKKTGFDSDACSMYGNESKPLCVAVDKENVPAFPKWLPTILLCVYLLITNILLVNLLIAIFGFTIGVIQDNTDKFWKFQRFSLIEEYCHRLPVPFPFVLVAYIYVLIKGIIGLLDKDKNQGPSTCCKGHENDKILLWESVMKENYLVKKNKKPVDASEK
uniref:Transient receptor potential cation channel subfamily M member 8 n=1 Tax=Latimeria chalumnae TaxID=7897 RepID=H3B2C4_LATCH